MTRDELLYYFDYDKDNGALIWKNHWDKAVSTKKIGKEAGYIKEGYRVIKLNNVNYLVHRLIWTIETGESPEIIDHIDGNKSNNRFSNLRLCSQRENCQNYLRHRSGKLVGATWHKRNKKWQAIISFKNSKNIHLGYFDTEKQAHEAYLNRLKQSSDHV